VRGSPRPRPALESPLARGARRHVSSNSDSAPVLPFTPACPAGRVSSAPGKLAGCTLEQFSHIGLDDPVAYIAGEPLAPIVEQQRGINVNYSGRSTDTLFCVKAPRDRASVGRKTHRCLPSGAGRSSACRSLRMAATRSAILALPGISSAPRMVESCDRPSGADRPVARARSGRYPTFAGHGVYPEWPTRLRFRRYARATRCPTVRGRRG
jgi:hypothetical protein